MTEDRTMYLTTAALWNEYLQADAPSWYEWMQMDRQDRMMTHRWLATIDELAA